MKFSAILLCLILPIASAVQESSDSLLRTEEIRIRDPFIYADSDTQLYYMYAQMDNRLGGRGDDSKPKGVEVYISSDLEHWQHPKTVLLIPEEFWARNMVWAPEMHEYNGKYYIFTTLTSSEFLEGQSKPRDEEFWPEMHKRGTQIFVSESPLGPFQPFENKAHTPEDWMALDGTLYVEDGIPYMIFCHEWVQVVDGTIDYVRLEKDLSGPVGEPKKMFAASDGEWVSRREWKVTDGCYMYKTMEGTLLMIWSSDGEKGYAEGYAVAIAESESGRLEGPWVQQEELLFKNQGGHGMIFRTFDDRLMLSLHAPNGPRGDERLRLIEIEDTGSSLRKK
ncbi:glycoside hydrolase family 43 protein [Pelagicoccus mobilis]|uniref:Family 43 glycosylhydrolase n=1 Tax=Pelagicoccus mobilis TaxID=415221 RepID=A0A934RXF4_9BACT|nr:glycoside hydrolase family 43 protein [Pelagicoccus mobilis]MBK1876132.1 family 43 glycosylhydrolase [Pelagicoccus mobilis]